MMSELKLSKSDQARIEKNRQRALLLRSSIVAKRSNVSDNDLGKQCHLDSSSGIDTGGGFLLDSNEAVDELSGACCTEIVEWDNGVDITNVHKCEECKLEFVDSYLWRKFDAAVCDTCRMKDEEKYGMITRTDAKAKFLLKDYDFENRGINLKYISKKNPHNPFSTEMRLYLRAHIEQLAVRVWGTVENLEEEKGIRKSKSEKMRQKKLEKRVKDLRRAVRTSTWHKQSAIHEHDFDSEIYDSHRDLYTKTCTSCGHMIEYEKM